MSQVRKAAHQGGHFARKAAKEQVVVSVIARASFIHKQQRSTQSVGTISSTQSVGTISSTQSVGTISSTQSVGTISSTQSVGTISSTQSIGTISSTQAATTGDYPRHVELCLFDAPYLIRRCIDALHHHGIGRVQLKSLMVTRGKLQLQIQYFSSLDALPAELMQRGYDGVCVYRRYCLAVDDLIQIVWEKQFSRTVL